MSSQAALGGWRSVTDCRSRRLRRIRARQAPGAAHTARGAAPVVHPCHGTVLVFDTVSVATDYIRRGEAFPATLVPSPGPVGAPAVPPTTRVRSASVSSSGSDAGVRGSWVLCSCVIVCLLAWAGATACSPRPLHSRATVMVAGANGACIVSPDHAGLVGVRQLVRLRGKRDLGVHRCRLGPVLLDHRRSPCAGRLHSSRHRAVRGA